MNIQKYLLPFLYVLITSGALLGQEVNGTIIDGESGELLEAAEISIRDLSISTKSGEKGEFTLTMNESGRFSFVVKMPGYDNYFSNFSIVEEESLDLGSISLYKSLSDEQKDVSYLSETEINSSEESSEVVSLLTASQDDFNRTAAFDFGVARFKIRGYHPNFTEIYFNGMPMNDIEDGYAAWSIWGGLNEVTRRKQSNHNLEPSFFAFGGLGGSNHVSTLASDQRKQIRASYSLTNRSYRQRLMLTYSTGMLKNGWAFSLSGSRRWSDEGYVEATFYDAYSYFASIDKKINNKHLLNLTVLNAPNQRGKNSGAIKELYDLAGTNYYNSYWGEQNGKKRNSRIARSKQPLAVMRHVWNLSPSTVVNTSVGCQGGSYEGTRLDWFNAADPRPNYYRYLPSYKENEEEALALENKLRNDPGLLQINWNNLYEINALSNETILNVDGIEGNDVTGKMSQYIIESQHQDPTKVSLNSYFQSELNDVTSLFGGLSYQYENIKNYKVVEDLLGGDFYVDLDKYAERDFPNNPEIIQNDLNHPNRILEVGDDFGYNYEIISDKQKIWLKGLSVFDKIDFFYSGEMSRTGFYRNGLYKNGKFPEESFGNSEKQSFLNYGFKGGATYKIDGRNYLYINGLAMSRAPYSRNAFISPRTRDHLVPNLESEKIEGGELGYELKSSSLSMRATLYYSQIRDQIKVRSFYHDDEASFVNYILQGIDEVHMGAELSAKYKITSSFEIKAVAALGDYYYNSRPLATISQDNNAEVLTDRVVYMKNFKIAGTPQRAYSLALSYNSPKYWFANLSFNYFDEIYLDFNPDRRTDEAVDGIDKEANPDLWYSIISQEKLDPGFVVNFFGGKSWKIKDYYVYLQLGVNNIMNNKTFITGGYEQLRYDYDERDVNSYPSRYYYSYGLNYYFNLSFRI